MDKVQAKQEREIKKECSETKQAICKLTDKRLNVDAQFIAFNIKKWKGLDLQKAPELAVDKDWDW